MKNQCFSPLLHANHQGNCSNCGTDICLICNPDGSCAGGCVEEMQEEMQDVVENGPQQNAPQQFFPQAPLFPPVQGINKRKHQDPILLGDEEFEHKRRAVAMIQDNKEVPRTDIVRIPQGLEFYGRIVQVEETQNRAGDLDCYYMVMECIDTLWFRSLPNDFQGLDWSQAAGPSHFCQVEFMLMPGELANLSHRLGGMAEIEEQAWVQVRFRPRSDDVPGVPVRVYFPPHGVTNPGATGIFGEENIDYMASRLQKIRSTTAVYQKLQSFQEYISN